MTPNEGLQRAWLALCGWRVGMVDGGGQAFDVVGCEADWATDAENSNSCLPALDSPANWGHWLAEYERLARSPARLLVDLKMDATLPSLLMCILCVRANRGQITVPPECLVWYELEGV